MAMKMLITSGRIASELSKRKPIIEQLVKRDVELTLAGYEKNMDDVCGQVGAFYAHVPMQRTGLNPLSDIKTLWHYYRLIKRERYDVVHSYTVKSNIYSAIAARLAGVKAIYPTVNGLGYPFTTNDFKTKIIRLYICMMYKLAFACARKVFIQNQDDADELIECTLRVTSGHSLRHSLRHSLLHAFFQASLYCLFLYIVTEIAHLRRSPFHRL